MIFDEQFTVGEHPRLELDVPSGNVRIIEGDVGVIRMRVDTADRDSLEISQIDDTVSLRQRSTWSLHNRSVRLTAHVPPGTDVDVHAASADVSLRARLGAVNVHTASGAIELHEAQRADLHSASGNIRVDAVRGDISAKSASGNITVDRADGRIGASLASGTFRCDHAGGSLDVGTASGDVRVGRCLGDEVVVKTVSGDVSLGLPGGIRVDPDISTLSGKTVLPRSAPSEPVGGDRRTVRLRLRTISGDIRIDRA